MKEKKVKNYYDGFSFHYNRMYKEIQQSKFKYVIHELNLSPGTIDLGGGTGLLSSFLNQQILTLDISLQMLSIGKKNQVMDQVIAGDLTNLPLRKSSLTQIYSFTAIQNCSNVGKAVKEIFRTTMNESNILITALKKGNMAEELALMIKKQGYDYKMIEFPIEDIGFRI